MPSLAESGNADWLAEMAESCRIYPYPFGNAKPSASLDFDSRGMATLVAERHGSSCGFGIRREEGKLMRHILRPLSAFARCGVPVVEPQQPNAPLCQKCEKKRREYVPQQAIIWSSSHARKCVDLEAR